MLLAAPACGSLELDGLTLHDLCTSPDPARQAYCLGFVRGHTAGRYFEMSRQDPDAPAPYCGADGVSMQGMVDVVVKYIEAHREAETLPAIMLVPIALSSAYPCTQ